MKRKLALLLAAVMTLSAAPMNLFAATNNKLSRSDIPVPDKALLYEPTVNVNAIEVEKNSDIKYVSQGSYLIITAESARDLPHGAAFNLVLTNGEWKFVVGDTGGTSTNKEPAVARVYVDELGITPVKIFKNDKVDAESADAFNEVGDYYLQSEVVAAVEKAALAQGYDGIEDSNSELISAIEAAGLTTNTIAPGDFDADFYVEVDGDYEKFVPGNVIADTKVAGNTARISVNVYTNSSDTRGVKYGSLGDAQTVDGTLLSSSPMYRNTIDINEGKIVNENGRYSYVRDQGTYNLKNATYPAAEEIPYRINFYSSKNSVEVVVDLNGYKLDADGNRPDYAAVGDALVIPLPVLNTEDGQDITMKVEKASGTAQISTSGKLNITSSSGGYTTTHVQGSLKRGSDTISGIDVTISENRVGSLAKGTFRLTAPNGYEFNNPTKWTYSFEAGLSDNGAGDITKPDETGGLVRAKYRNTGSSSSSKDNLNQVEVTINDITRSTERVGILVLGNIELIAEDETKLPTTSENLKAKIQNTGKTDIVTNETFDIAIAANYTLVLSKVENKTPELVSGRLDEAAQTERAGSKYTPGDIDDDYHKVDKIQLRENVGDSWWSTSGTTLVLPDGVRFLKVEFDELANFADTINFNGTENNQGFANAHRREESFITINDNVLTLNNLKTTSNTTRTKLQMDIWVNIEADFEGDIDLTLTNYSVRTGENTDQSVTVATAVTPVVVETTVSDVKIGLQYVPVADFNITETKAGNLLQGKDVYITVSDEISTDMYLAPGFTHEVSEGNLKISKVNTKSTLTTVGTTNNDAQLKFEIDRESTVASTISFSNVQVKIGRDVPYSNVSNTEDRGINLIVWGPAIAENYEGLWDVRNNNDKTLSSYDFFATPGIRAKYINVISKDTTNNNNFTNVVEVTIGNPVVLINGEEYTMPVAAYVSTASNSTMVPLRFVAYALGLAEDAVTWDMATSTATVDAGTRVVQFTSGSNYYVVNGVQVGMTSPDGLPVSTEINEERAFIPFRMLGNAFDIPVTWDGTTSTAIYNDPSAL